jgi:serine/threonine-protein kinase
MPIVGELLAGRYELRSQLGRGGMAEVFRALDRRLGREVAVKILAGHLLSDPRSVERFEREGRTAAALNHPNVVDVYDAASEGDIHYMVMELVEGPTLAEVIEREGRLPVPRALDIAGRVAAALQVAHDRGLVHHDVKPSNVLFDSDGEVKVADFGIARAASSDITTIQGTPPYVAPEQARGGRADPRSDVYSLGASLYRCLAGRPLFKKAPPEVIAQMIIQGEIPALRRVNPAVPRRIARLVHKSLALDPAKRFHSSGEMHEALEAERIRLGLESTSPAERLVSFLYRDGHLSAEEALTVVDPGLLDATRGKELPAPGQVRPQVPLAVGFLGAVVLAVVLIATMDQWMPLLTAGP